MGLEKEGTDYMLGYYLFMGLLTAVVLVWAVLAFRGGGPPAGGE